MENTHLSGFFMVLNGFECISFLKDISPPTKSKRKISIESSIPLIVSTDSPAFPGSLTKVNIILHTSHVFVGQLKYVWDG